MQQTLLFILLSLVITSVISLVGALTLLWKKKLILSSLTTMVAFAAGTFLGVAFFDLLPETIDIVGSNGFSYVLIGLIIFFVIERFIQWHHCHVGHCDVHPSGYINLIGDATHNFVDGVVIATTYLIDVKLGLLTTFAIALHEIPQELSDFAVLVKSGFKPSKALLFNFIGAVFAIVGGLLTYFFIEQITSATPFLLALAAGSFIYMSLADLIPQLHRQRNKKKIVKEFFAFMFGVLLIFGIISLVPESEPAETPSQGSSLQEDPSSPGPEISAGVIPSNRERFCEIEQEVSL